MGSEPESDSPEWWSRLTTRFERTTVLALIFMLMGVVASSTIALGWSLIRDLYSGRHWVLDVEETFALFGSFLLVLIGLELMTTLKTLLRAGVVQLEVVLEVALIAVAQKIIVLDSYRAGPLMLIGLSALVLALSGAFLLARARR